MGFSGNGYSTASTVITSQGDLRIGNSVGAAERLAIGSSGKVLESNGTTASWQTLSTADSTLTTQGDVLYEGASGLARLGQSTDGYVLTTKGASANPVWAAVSAGATVSKVQVSLDATFTTTSTTYVDVTDWTLTKPNITDGICFGLAAGTAYGTTGVNMSLSLNDNGSAVAYSYIRGNEASPTALISVMDLSVTDGNTLLVQMRVSSGSGSIAYNEDDAVPKLVAFGVG